MIHEHLVIGWNLTGGGLPCECQVVVLVQVLVSSAVNDAGHGGSGNVTALIFDVQTPQGAEAGKAQISCTVFTPDVQLCHAGFVLADGQIEAQASIPQAGATFTAAIIGGTGTYDGVTGQIRNVRQCRRPTQGRASLLAASRLISPRIGAARE
jgi:hypothetical protein